MMTPAEKPAARESARAARCALDAGARTAANAAITERALALPLLDGVRVVLSYSATAEEVDPSAIDRELRAAGVVVALPRIEEPGVLGLHAVADPAELVAGPFGIREPAQSAPRVAADTIDAVLVPGVAFDAHGTRVGFGGGYYDRLLPLLEGAARIGLAFDCQVSSAPLPSEEHDEPVDVVITETRVIPAE